MTTFLKIMLAGVAMAYLTACSKTVQWKEEVPLNTGEVIWVKRTGSYEFESEFGNPLKFAYRPQWRTRIEFTYQGKLYSHTDDAGLMLLAISGDGTPNLVASAAQFDWHLKNQYYCVVPYYVQFRPDSTGKKWTWPSRIEPWLYGLQSNLMFGVAQLNANGKKFASADRERENASLLALGDRYKQIAPTFDHPRCLRRN